MAKKKIEVVCPHCDKKIKLVRDRKGRWIATLSGVTLGGIIGGVIGTVIGIASGGWGIAGTIPVGVALGTILGGAGYMVGDKLVDKFTCPSCNETVDL